MNHATSNGRNLASLLAEIKDEIWDFFETRYTMLTTELKEKSRDLKRAAILAVSAGLLLITAYLLITFALVGLVVAAFPASSYRWFYAFIAVGILWSIFGAIAAYFAKRELELRGILPKRTIEILKGDKVWVEAEVRNHS